MSAFVTIIDILYTNAKISSTNLQGHFSNFYEVGCLPKSDSASASDHECFRKNTDTPEQPHTWRTNSAASTRGDGARREKKEEDVWEEKQGVEGY